MSSPDWRHYKGGSTARAALWLATEVGEGGVFTKEQLRSAFPGVAQIDRRARDLRAEGWVIYTNREDVSLAVGEQRLVHVGGRIWEKGYRRRGGKTLSSKERRQIYARDNYCCVLCGVSGGEFYPDDTLRKAKLMIGKVGSHEADQRLSTMCDRCHLGQPIIEVDVDTLKVQIDSLDELERGRLNRWARAGRRTVAAEEKVWQAYRNLPAEARNQVNEWLFRDE